ncbi:substrate-binding domain-containing protein [Aeoliella sp. SH292]|uniref:substrate-binding domain-containing protein n=1 Tax=Aeoliella sp. SH292 TaxID=3454464 RepID=UPI003F9C83C0
MSEFKTRTPQIVDLAERLISDIEARKLKPGDRYLTTVAASRMLGVGNGAANRALQLLERRQIIVRQQRLGAFIASLPSESPTPLLQRVHFLVHQNYLATEGVGSDLVLLGMQEELPGVPVQFSFLPEDNAHGHVQNLVDRALTGKSKDGFVLVRAPYEVQHLISNLGVPCVVYGGLYPGIEGLCRIDRDMGGIGTLATDYLLKRGHKRIAFLSRQMALPGDHDTMDAIRERMTARKLLANAIVERFLPTAESACEAEVGRLLDAKNPPTGFICRAKRMADGAMAALEKRGLHLTEGYDIVLCDYHLGVGQSPEYVYPRPLYSLEEQGRHIARMLAERARGEECQNEVIPVIIDDSAVKG